MSLLTADIVTYNASIVYGMLNSLGTMFGSTAYQSLIAASFTVAYSYYVVTNAQGSNTPSSIINLAVAMVLVTSMVFVKGNAVVTDTTVNETKIIRNLPIGVVLLGGVVSQFADLLTKSFETHFSVPDDGYMNFRKFGTMFGSFIIDETAKASITSPRLSRNMNQFMAQCIVPDIRIKARYTLENLFSSNNPWGIIKDNTSRLRGFEYDDGVLGRAPEFKTCHAGALLLDVDLREEAAKSMDTLESKLASKLGATTNLAKHETQNFNTRVKSHIRNALTSQISGAHDMLVNISDDSFNILKRHMVRNYLTEMPQTYGVMKGSHSAAESYAIERAKLVQKNSMFISGALAPENLVRLYCTFQALVYGLFALVVLFLPFPIGIQVLIKYIGIMVWVHSWPIFFALINYIQNESLYNSLSSATTGSGWTIYNSPLVAKFNMGVAETAGMLTSSVPALALLLVYGAGHAVHVAGGWFGKLEGAADDTSRKITDGNLDGGNLNINNRSAHNNSMYHHNTKASYSGVGGSYEMNTGSIIGVTGQGDYVVNQNPGISQIASSFRTSESIQTAINEQMQTSKTAMMSQQASYSEAFANTAHSAYQLAVNGGLTTSSNTGYSSADTQSFAQSATEMQRLTKDFAERHGLTEQQAGRLLTGVGADAKFGFNSKNSSVAGAIGKVLFGVNAEAGVNASANLSYHNDNFSEEQFQAAKTFVKDTNFDEKMDSLVRASKDIGFNENQHVNENLTNTHANNLDVLERSSSDYQASLQRHHALSELSQFSKSHTATFDANMQQFLVKKVSDMQDENGNLLGAAGADKVLKSPHTAKPYIDKVFNDNFDELTNIYKSSSTGSIDAQFDEFNDTVASKSANIASNNTNNNNELVGRAESNGISLDKNSIDHKAQYEYEAISSEVKEQLETAEQKINKQGKAQVDKVEQGRDQDKKGLIRRSFTNLTDNVGGRGKDDS